MVSEFGWAVVPGDKTIVMEPSLLSTALWPLMEHRASGPSDAPKVAIRLSEGKAGAAYDPVQQHAAEQRVFGPETPFFGWHYPPFFLVPAAALATLPYGWAVVACRARRHAMRGPDCDYITNT